MSKSYWVAIGYVLSLLGAVLLAGGGFSLYAHYTGQEANYRIVLDQGLAWASVLLGVVGVVAGVTMRKGAK